MLKNILLDLDDTILDFHKAERVALSKTLESLGIPVDDDILNLYSKINAKCWEMMEQGLYTKQEILEKRFFQFFYEIGTKVDPVLAENIYEDNLMVGHYFMPYALETIKELRKKYNLYIISNGRTLTQKARIKSAKIKKYFKKIFVSEKIGLSKPDKEYFDYCLKKSHIKDKSTCIIVGDSLSSDILGGINIGIKTIWYNFRNKELNNKIKPDYIIKDLREIKNIIE